jgi:hypothetical protein
METMLELYQQGKTSDSSIRTLWQSYQQSYLEAKQEEMAKEMNLALQSNFVHTSKGSLTCRKILRHGGDGFTSLPKECVLRIFIALKNTSPTAGFEPSNLGPNSKQANH